MDKLLIFPYLKMENFYLRERVQELTELNDSLSQNTAKTDEPADEDTPQVMSKPVKILWISTDGFHIAIFPTANAVEMTSSACSV